MISTLASLFLGSWLLTAIDPTQAAQPVTTFPSFLVKVIDYQKNPVADLPIGFGGAPNKSTDPNGFVLVPRLWKDGERVAVTLGVRNDHKGMVILSPVEEIITIPNDKEGAKSPVTIEVSTKGDRSSLNDIGVQRALIRKTLAKANDCFDRTASPGPPLTATAPLVPSTPKDEAVAAEPRAQPSGQSIDRPKEEVANQFGFSTDDIDRAARSLEEDGTDSDRRIASQYHSLFTGFGESYNMYPKSVVELGAGASYEAVFAQMPGPASQSRLLFDFNVGGRIAYMAWPAPNTNPAGPAVPKPPRSLNNDATTMSGVQLGIDIDMTAIGNYATQPSFDFWRLLLAAFVEARGWNSFHDLSARVDLTNRLSGSTGANVNTAMSTTPSLLGYSLPYVSLEESVSYDFWITPKMTALRTTLGGEQPWAAPGNSASPPVASFEAVQRPRWTGSADLGTVIASEAFPFPGRVGIAATARLIPRWTYSTPLTSDSLPQAINGFWLNWRVAGYYDFHSLTLVMGWRSERLEYGALEALPKVSGFEFGIVARH